MEYFGYNAGWNGCVDYSKITLEVVEVCRSGGYGIVVSHSPIYDSA